MQLALDMSYGEIEDRRRIEATLAHGLKSFIEVGNALQEMRDRKLYRNTHGTFEDYCREQWGMARRTAYQFIEAATVVENVRNCAQIEPPINEAQTRPLTGLPPSEQIAVWQEAVETAPNGKVTAAHVAEVVDRRSNPAPHVTHNSGENEWYTPAKYIDAARAVMGGIDLDPASSLIANQTVQAAMYYTAEDNGLSRPWSGRVWLNPPYAQPLIGLFCGALRDALESGTVAEAISLTNNATETAWFADLLANAAAVCFVRGRIKFVDMSGRESGAPLQGQVVVYSGPNVSAFGALFSVFGTVLYTEID